MNTHRHIALTAGLIYLATFATSFPALALKTAYLEGSATASTAAWGAVLEILLAATCVGTAVVLYPVTRRVSETLALSFVASRTIEAAMILSGVLALMSVMTLRTAGSAGAGAGLVALHDWAFLLGPAVMSAVNGLLLGTVMLRGRLVPRIIPIVGLIGAPLLLASSVGVIFGAWAQTSPVGMISALPIALWELSLGLWLTLKGFSADATTSVPPGRGHAQILSSPR
jgi:hypothetical protein